jgi:hypothetical protein
MEDVLDVYVAEHTEDEPLICMDEASKQLLADGLPSIPPAPGRPRREDYHYERNGTQALFLFFNPVSGWRRVSCRDSRTRIDWAEEVRQLLEEDYPRARRIKLVCDNLNTHGIASLYEAFTAAEAHRLNQRLEIHYTPRNGSWLNVAEIELGVLSRQCLNRRIPTASVLRDEIVAWQAERNLTASKVRWQFTRDDARRKLHRLYPQL